MTDIEVNSGPQPTPDVLERSLTIAAPPEIVFRFFTDPDRMTAWMGRTATLEPRPGGALRIVYNDHDVARGEYVEVDAPRRVVFTWGWEAPDTVVGPGGSRVEVDLEPVEAGTSLRLRHLGLPGPEVPTHGEGWDHFLGRLVTAVTAVMTTRDAA